MGQEPLDHFSAWTNDKFWEACIAIHLKGELQATLAPNSLVLLVSQADVEVSSCVQCSNYRDNFKSLI